MSRRHRLDELVEIGPVDPAAVRSVVAEVRLFVWSSVSRSVGLARPVRDPDLLHVPAEDEAGRAWIMVPAYTARRHMQPSIERNPEWRDLTILDVSGAELLAHLRQGLMLVVNPWTDHELRIPSL